MEKHKNKFTLDVSGQKSLKYVDAKKGDKGARMLEITLTSNGEPYMVAEGCTVQFRCTKPSGKIVLNPASLSGGTVVANLTEQVLAEEGMTLADIAIMDPDGNRLSSCTFVIRVYDSAGEGEDIESTNEFQALDGLVAEAKKATEEHKQWGEVLMAAILVGAAFTPILDDEGRYILDDNGNVIVDGNA